MTYIHPTVIIEGDVKIGANVRIGPYTVIKGPVKIGQGTVIEANVNIEGPTEIGMNNKISSFCSIGTPPQDLKYNGEPTKLIIGNKNVFREFVTLNRGTVGGGGTTRVGSEGLFMAYAHIAHDCQVGDHVIFANAATLAGHVSIGDRSVVGAFTGVHQFCRVGPFAFIGGYSVITRDALPFIKTVGERNNAGIYGINSIGLKRLGFSEERIEKLQKAYRLLFRKSSNISKGLDALRQNMEIKGDVEILVNFIETSQRGVIH